jgi:hypothetical protein
MLDDFLFFKTQKFYLIKVIFFVILKTHKVLMKDKLCLKNSNK